jgi:hypothetical protein
VVRHARRRGDNWHDSWRTPRPCRVQDSIVLPHNLCVDKTLRYLNIILTISLANISWVIASEFVAHDSYCTNQCYTQILRKLTIIWGSTYMLLVKVIFGCTYSSTWCIYQHR